MYYLSVLTSHPGQLGLLHSVEAKNEYQSRTVMLCHCGVGYIMAGVAHFTCGYTGGRQVKLCNLSLTGALGLPEGAPKVEWFNLLQIC